MEGMVPAKIQKSMWVRKTGNVFKYFRRNKPKQYLETDQFLIISNSMTHEDIYLTQLFPYQKRLCSSPKNRKNQSTQVA